MVFIADIGIGNIILQFAFQCSSFNKCKAFPNLASFNHSSGYSFRIALDIFSSQVISTPSRSSSTPVASCFTTATASPFFSASPKCFVNAFLKLDFWLGIFVPSKLQTDGEFKWLKWWIFPLQRRRQSFCLFVDYLLCRVF